MAMKRRSQGSCEDHIEKVCSVKSLWGSGHEMLAGMKSETVSVRVLSKRFKQNNSVQSIP